jgi:hypothetical protein
MINFRFLADWFSDLIGFVHAGDSVLFGDNQPDPTLLWPGRYEDLPAKYQVGKYFLAFIVIILSISS